MSVRRLPVRPDLDQLKHQAKDLLRAVHAGDPAAITELVAHIPGPVDPASARLADAQLPGLELAPPGPGGRARRRDLGR